MINTCIAGTGICSCTYGCWEWKLLRLEALDRASFKRNRTLWNKADGVSPRLRPFPELVMTPSWWEPLENIDLKDECRVNTRIKKQRTHIIRSYTIDQNEFVEKILTLKRCIYNKVKGKDNPCSRPWRPIGLWDVEAPTFSLDSRLTDGGAVVSLTRRSLFIPRKIPGTHFC
jgi:hypothetical protein